MKKKVTKKRSKAAKLPQIERSTGQTWHIHMGCGDEDCPYGEGGHGNHILHTASDQWFIRPKYTKTWQGLDGSGNYELTLEHAPKGAKTTGLGWHKLARGVCLSSLESIFGRPAGYDSCADTPRPTGLIRVLAKRVR